MATDADEPTAAPEAASNADSIASSSDSDSDSGEASGKSVEWLATGREKRSTAGNRMKSLLATATPADEDSDLELLFQEDEDDVGFTDKEDDDGSDAAMESTDDEDENEAHEDDAGEKELERQAKEKRAAARKRKAQEAIPAKFRKKVRIQPPDASGAGTAAAPPPRPKKKSERASWLPTEAEMPTRASGRKTTQLSKEQLHLQMIDREAKRLKQVELMERQAKRKEAMKKPPMTQAERLREAAIVEKRNAKSLNRWEEAEKQREEERRAKLAALNNRRLEGPVVTFWTGIIDLSEVQLKHVGKMVTMEEKPKRKRPATAAGKETASSAVLGTEDGPPETADATAITQSAPGLSSRPETPREPETPKVEPTTAVPVDTTPSTFMPSIHRPSVPLGPSNVPLRPAAEAPRLPPVPFQPTPSPTFRPITPAVTFGAPMPPTPTGPQNPFKLNANAAFAPPIPSPMVKTEPPSSKPMPLALRPDIGPRFMPPPNPHFALPAPPTQLLPSVGASSGQMPAVAARSAIPIAPVASLSALGPGPGLRPGPPPPLVPSLTQALSISPPPTNPNALTAFPSPHQIPTPQPPPGHTTASFQPIFPTSPPVDVAKKQQIEQAVPKKSNGKASAARKASIVPEPPVPEPPMEGKVTRACIILQDFDEDAIKKPDVQTQILFGWKMNRLAKPPHPPLCVITNQPARYRDPKTGLPYHNTYAFKEIQKLTKGNFKWSKLLGTWVGNASEAANGVPDRFIHPETEEQRKERLERKEQDKKMAEEQRHAAEAAKTAETSAVKTEEPSFAPMPDADVAMSDAAPSPPPGSVPASVPAFAVSNMVPPVPVGAPAMRPSSGDGRPVVPSPAPVASMESQSGQGA